MGAIAAAAVGGLTSAVVGSALAGGGSQGAGFTAGANALSQTQADIAKQQFQFWQQNYQPLEQQLIPQVQNLTSPEMQERQAAVQGAQTASAYDTQMQSLKRQAMSYGLAPNSGPYAAQVGALTGAKASGVATSENNARWNTLLSGLSAQENVAALGRGLPMSAMSGLGQAAQTQSNLANSAYGRYYQNANSLGYALQPFGQAAGNSLANWFGSTSGGNQTPSQSAAANYGGSGSVDTVPYGGFDTGGGGGASFGGGPMMADGGLARAVRRDSGGGISGPGTDTSDEIPAEVEGSPIRLSDGEHVMNTEAVKLLGRDFLDRANKIGLRMRKRGYADGGEPTNLEEAAPTPQAAQPVAMPSGQAPQRWPVGQDGQPVPGAADNIPFKVAQQWAQSSGMPQFTWKGRTFDASTAASGPAPGGRASPSMTGVAKTPLKSTFGTVGTGAGGSAMVRDLNANSKVAVVIPVSKIGGLARALKQTASATQEEAPAETQPFNPQGYDTTNLVGSGRDASGGETAKNLDDIPNIRAEPIVVEGRRARPSYSGQGAIAADVTPGLGNVRVRLPDDTEERDYELQPQSNQLTLRPGRMARGGKVGGLARAMKRRAA